MVSRAFLVAAGELDTRLSSTTEEERVEESMGSRACTQVVHYTLRLVARYCC